MAGGASARRRIIIISFFIVCKEENDHYLLWDVFLHNNAYLENCIDDGDCPLEKPICRNGKCEGMLLSKLGRG